MDPTGNDISRTPDSRGDPNRFRGAVQGTGAAFHQKGFFPVHDEHTMLPYDGAAAAESFSVIIFSFTDIDMFRSQCSLWARGYTTMTYLHMASGANHS